MKARVAIITGTLQLGGSTTFVFNLSTELVKRQVPCLVISGEAEHPMADDFNRSNVEVMLCDERREIFEDRVQRTLQRLRAFKPDTVIANLAPFEFEVLRYLPQGVFRIGVVHSDEPNVYPTLKNYAPWMDAIVGVSASIVRRLNKISEFNHVSKHHLSCGVPMPKELTRQVRSSGTVRILYLGRLANELKRVHLFPEIAAGLEKTRTPFHWTIAGDGPDRAALQNRMTHLRLASHVQFVGVVNYAKIGALFGSHDIFLLVSDYEGLPLSLLEAMGHGLVPVVSDLESGIREVVDASSGVLVPVEDVNGYARAIVHLHENRGELAAKSAHARDRVRTKFSVESMTDRWLSILKVAEAPVIWPRDFRVHGPIMDAQQWKYACPVRSVRRLAKIISGRFL
jgi:glycosyltransferase involved in cell wall biosynthesis